MTDVNPRTGNSGAAGPAVSTDEVGAFSRRVRAGTRLFGSFLNLGSPLTAELMAIAGLDWLVVDLEHGAGDERDALAQVQAVAHTGASVVVRVEAIAAPRFARALDAGAAGVLVPRVETRSEAEQCVRYVRYSELRGVARYNRGSRWGLANGDLTAVDDGVLCAVQIESLGAVENAAEIAAVDGVDVLFIGPGDLGHSLNATPAADDPKVAECARVVAEATEAAGKAAGVLVATLKQAELYVSLGYTFIGYSSDSGLLMAQARASITALRELDGGGQPS